MNGCVNHLKRMCITAFFFLAVVSCFATKAAAAESGSISIICDDENHTVSVTGVIPSGHTDRKILLFVIKPQAAAKQIDDSTTLTEEDFQYIAQTTTDRGGQYTFGFTLDESVKGGEYLVRVGAALNDEVQTGSFYYVNENLIQEAIDKINRSGATDGEVKEYITDTYVRVFKCNLDGDYQLLSDSGKERIFAGMNAKNNYQSLAEVRTEFDRIVQEQKLIEYKEKVIAQINQSGVGQLEDCLFAFNDLLQLPLAGEQNPFSIDYNQKDGQGQFVNKASVFTMMKALTYSGIEEIQSAFYRALGLTMANHVTQGNNGLMGEILQRYSLYFSISGEYLDCSDTDKREVHKLLIGKAYTSASQLQEEIASAVRQIKEEQQSPVRNSGTGGSGSGTSKISVGDAVMPNPDFLPEEISGVFDDIDGVDWAQESINKLAAMKIVKGFPTDNSGLI